MSVEPIRVELESFCQQFSAALEPFSDALEKGAHTLRQAGDESPLPALLGNLQDNRHRLKILLDKARQQNTYLVIFGPLKSGKSTLMNAISGAYVSEVTSLPAYPCLVYVREGDSHGMSTTAFNGDRHDYATRGELHASLENAHQSLAQRLREADAAGTAFNPAQDFTEAIRRIDFTMPAPALRESGTILVDTPGLYTKMKYGYGQLTRDFRDTAACAVFVVKTDNLFFEQVFEEFADLLDVFSRIFLVVNIDSSKQDLGPDGTLRPSLEQSDPKRIIEAFENLTVSAEIRSAIQSGRLNIYLIDLLQTAAKSLQAGDPAPNPATTEDSSGSTGGEEEVDNPVGDEALLEKARPPEDGSSGDPANHVGPQIGFDSFLSDLTDYLNSSDYIVAFIRDSLRQANSILHEVRDHAKGPEISTFRGEIEALEGQTETASDQLQTLDQLRKQEWSGPLEALASEIRQQVTEHSGSVLRELETSLHHEVANWAESDASMQDLVENRIHAKVKEVCQRSRNRAVEIFDRVCRDRNGGVRTGEEVSRRLRALDLSFDDIYPTFQTIIRETLEAEPELPDVSGLQNVLPLRRRWIDWILFRSDARVRQSVFGTTNPSERTFSAKAKIKRLSEDNIREFCGTVGDYARESNLLCVQEVLEHLLREYKEAFLAGVRQRVEACEAERRAEYEKIKGELDFRKQVLLTLEAMDAASDTLEAQGGVLQKRFIPREAVFEIHPGEDDLESGPPSSDNHSESN